MINTYTHTYFIQYVSITRQGYLSVLIIQQIVTMPIYGKKALNICHPYMTDILQYT